MEIDLMTGPSSWDDVTALAREVEYADFSGIVFTETSQVPWMQIALAATTAPRLTFCTGIAVAFPRSPMVSAMIAYELAANTGGRFRLGLGSQVKAHITRRYGADFDHPAARLKDYVLAVKACFRAFDGEERLHHDGEFYELSLLPPDWTPPAHDHPMTVDISAVGPVMCRVAGEVADGIHVHPLHSVAYVENRLKPAVAEGAARSARGVDDVALIVPVFVVAGDTPEERREMAVTAKRQIGFYGTTPNYAFQFDDLGFHGTTDRLRQKMKAGDLDGMVDLITDEMLEVFAVVSTWDELADRLLDRYRGTASRLVMYSAASAFGSADHLDVDTRGRWAEVARAIRAG